MTLQYYFGAEKVSMSPKGRVIVPQKFRSIIDTLENKTLFLLQDPHEKIILVQDIRTPKNYPAYETNMDAWGYIVLPPTLISYANLEPGRDKVGMMGEGKWFTVSPSQAIDDMWKKTPQEFANLFDGFSIHSKKF